MEEATAHSVEEESVEQTKPKRKPRKKGRSAYQNYKAQMKATFQEQNPEDGYSDLSKKMKEAWDALSQEERETYQVQTDSTQTSPSTDSDSEVVQESTPLPPLLKAKALAKQGVAVQDLFKAAQTHLDKQGKSKTTRKPRIKGRSAYQAWKAHHKQQFTESNPDDDYSSLSKKMKDAWDALSEEEQAPFKQESEKVRQAASGLTPPHTPTTA